MTISAPVLLSTYVGGFATTHTQSVTVAAGAKALVVSVSSDSNVQIPVSATFNAVAIDDFVLVNGTERGAALFIMFDPPAITADVVATLSGDRFANMVISTVDADGSFSVGSSVSTSGNVVNLTASLASASGEIILSTGASNTVAVVDPDIPNVTIGKVDNGDSSSHSIISMFTGGTAAALDTVGFTITDSAKQAGLVAVALIESSPAQIDDIDGDDNIQDGQGTATLTTSGFGSDVNSVKITDGTYTGANLFIGGAGGSWTFTVPEISTLIADSAAGQPDYFTGSLQLEVSDGTDTVQAPFTWSVIAGHLVNTINGNTTATGSISENRGSPYSDGSSSYATTADSTLIDGAGLIYTSATSDFTVQAWDVDTGTIELVNVIVSGGGGGGGGASQGGIFLGLAIKI